MASPLPALGLPSYRPRSPGGPLRSIVETHLEELVSVYDDRFARTHGPLTPRVVELFERFVRCGDPHFGFLRLRCEDCGHERLLSFSCKARGLCPSCGKRRALQWAERMVEEVLPQVSYAPLVFTIPKMARRGFLFDRRLYGDLCRVAYRVVRDLLQARFPELDRPVPAFLASTQSFGSLLNFHPHVHGLASLGVFDRSGEFHEDLDLDFGALELPFRDAFLETLEKRGRWDAERSERIRQWAHSGFRVHTERVIPAGARSELESLLEYFERPPISLKRLTLLDSGLAHYQGRYHPGLGTDHRLVTGVEFLAPHIQHRYEAKTRTYGALSTTFRKRVGWIGHPPELRGPGDGTAAPSHADDTSSRPGPRNSQDDVSEKAASKPKDARDLVDDDTEAFVQARRRGWAQLIQKVWLDDPEECEVCRGRMKIIQAVISPQQDRVIERILKARGEWSPPWSTRAPPPGAALPAPRLDRELDDPPEPRVDYDIDPASIWDDD